MTNVPPGPGWWLASNGHWYPPDILPPERPAETPLPATAAGPGDVAGPDGPAGPGDVAGPPTTMFPVGPLGPFGQIVQTGQEQEPSAVLRGPAGGRQDLLWRTDLRRPVDTVIRDYHSSGDRLPQAFDPRGIFVGAASLLLVVACALPYYHVISAGRSGLQTANDYTVLESAFGRWRLALPAVGVLAILVGVLNSFLRAGATGAVGVFVALRLVALVQLGLWILVTVDRKVAVAHAAIPALVPAPGTTPVIAVTWLAWPAIGVAAAALVGSFAAMRKPDSA